MKIRNNSGPQRCVLCLRDKDEAVREHLLTNKPCCPNCPLGDIIKEALNKTTFDSVNHNNEDSEKNISKDIVDFIVWVIVGIFVYYLTYIVWEWNQILWRSTGRVLIIDMRQHTEASYLYTPGHSLSIAFLLISDILSVICKIIS